MLPVHAAMSFLNVIAASLTPAILVLAAGSLVSSTLARISRIVDHARLLMDRICAARLRGDAAAADVDIVMLHVYERRSSLAGRALLLYYAAIGLFVSSTLAITADSLTKNGLPLVCLTLVIAGTILVLLGTGALVIEANVASGVLESEIAATCSAQHATPRTHNARDFVQPRDRDTGNYSDLPSLRRP
jgi:hypothetical protein